MIKARGITETEIAEGMAAAERQTASDASRAYLRETDWYVMRMIETRRGIPVDVLDKRQAAREHVLQTGEEHHE